MVCLLSLCCRGRDGRRGGEGATTAFARATNLAILLFKCKFSLRFFGGDPNVSV